MYVRDTIAAISTPLGEAGLGVIRVSGDEAIEVVDKIFKGKKHLKDTDTYQARYGYIVDYKTEKRIDEVICLVMRSPKSFTTEDIVEVGCHGGVVPLRRILNAILDAGARLAEPGEFTKRAFLNGRIDLAQAEAIIQIINSKTEKGMEIAVQQLEGGLSSKISTMRQKLIRILAHLEAALDFPEDEIEGFSEDLIDKQINNAVDQVDQLLKTSQSGKILREGIKTSIVGRPNVGKSSLLNALLREQRAIVTEVPGTTRDVIEEMINLDGIPLRLIDTAGIRDTEDVVEKIGVERSKEFINQADLILLVLDVSQELTEEDYKIIELVKGKKTIVVVNKMDLDVKIDKSKLKDIFPEDQLVFTSILEEEGLEELKKTIVDLVFEGEVVSTDETIVTNLRHQRALEDAYQSLLKAKESLDANMPYDFLTIDLKDALQSLGKITGEALSEDIIDQIFAEFCLGK